MSLVDYTWVTNARGQGSTYDDSYPWRIVLHTTEGADVSASYISGHAYPPQLWYNPNSNAKFQTIPLTRGGFALEQYASQGVVTNRGKAIQVEIVGFAADDWPDAKLKLIAKNVIVPIVLYLRSIGGDIDFDNVPPVGVIGGSASASAPQRLSEQAWRSLNGACGHRHVPGNEHWDTGNMDIQRIFQIAKSLLSNVPPEVPVEEVDVTIYTPELCSTTFPMDLNDDGVKHPCNVHKFQILPKGAVLLVEALDLVGGQYAIVTETATGTQLGKAAFYHPGGVARFDIVKEQGYSVYIVQGASASIKAYK